VSHTSEWIKLEDLGILLLGMPANSKPWIIFRDIGELAYPAMAQA
jgi:hypothetical protein